MLDPRWRKVVGDVWLHKSRMLIVVPAIAAGSIGAGAVLNTWALVERATARGFMASNPRSATIYADSLGEPLLEKVRAMPAIADAQARGTIRAGIRTQGLAGQAVLFTADDLTSLRIGVVEPELGAWPPADGAIVVERSSVDFAGVSLGDRVTVVAGDAQPIVLAVSGIARDVGLAPGWMEHVVYGFVSRGTLQRLGLSSSLDELVITVRDRGLGQDEVRRIAYAVKALVEESGRVVSDVDVPVPGEHIHQGQMNTLLYTQGAFGILALILSAFLVVNLVNAMLAGQLREIGVMKTIGARPAQLAGMYLTFALVLGVAASVIALPSAAFIGRRYGAFKAELLNFEVSGHAIPAWAILIQALVGVLMPVVAAAIPVWRGTRLSVASALRDFGITADAGGSAGILTHVSGVARPLLLSLRNAFRRRQRLTLTLVTLALGGASYIGAGNLRAAIGRGMDLAFAPRRFDFSVRLGRPHRADSIEALAGRVPGVMRAEAWAGAQAAVVHDDGTLSNSFPITAPPLDTRLLTIPLDGGRWPVRSAGNGIVVSSRLLTQERLEVGSEVALMIAGRRTRWRVVGVSSGGLSTESAYASRDDLAAIVSGGLVSTVAVASESSGAATLLDLVRRVRAELDGAGFEVVSTTVVKESRRVTEDHLLMVADFLGVMAWVIILVGGLGLASTMSLAVLERTREIGVLRAIGAGHGSILAIVLVEGLMIAVLGWVLAIPLSMPISAILVSVFSRTMLSVPLMLVPGLMAVLVWLGLAVVVAAVATTWPALRAMRITTAAALAYE